MIQWNKLTASIKEGVALVGVSAVIKVSESQAGTSVLYSWEDSEDRPRLNVGITLTLDLSPPLNKFYMVFSPFPIPLHPLLSISLSVRAMLKR